MDIHHAMMVRNRPERLYEALTRAADLSVWMAAPVVIEPSDPAAVGSVIELRYGQGPKPEHVQRPMSVEVTKLEVGKMVQWRVIQPVWPRDRTDEAQVVTWTLSEHEISTLVDFRMEGWGEKEEAYASVSYKWAGFMFRLKIYLGDVREIVDMSQLVAGRQV